MYKKLIRPLFFLFQPESVHHFVISVLKGVLKIPGFEWFLKKWYVVESPALKRTVFGIDFPGPVGLAAGFDKNALLVDGWPVFGFGFIEIGTVTPLAQPGNIKPRNFRLVKDQAIINRMGFNNDGSKQIAERLRRRKSGIIIGGNIGKNKVTPNDKAIHDYETCFLELYDAVDYFVVNVSSPNTPGLRELQEKEPLKKLLNRLQEINGEQSKKRNALNRKPLLLKIAPDLTNEQLDDIIKIVLETKLDGIVATNTTTSRANLVTEEKTLESIGAGGLSGKPLTKRSTEVIRYIHEKSNGQLVIVGVGGIHSAEDAMEKIHAGAALVQVYTGFVYEGPALVKQINKAVAVSRT